MGKEVAPLTDKITSNIILQIYITRSISQSKVIFIVVVRIAKLSDCSHRLTVWQPSSSLSSSQLKFFFFSFKYLEFLFCNSSFSIQKNLRHKLSLIYYDREAWLAALRGIKKFDVDYFSPKIKRLANKAWIARKITLGYFLQFQWEMIHLIYMTKVV